MWPWWGFLTVVSIESQFLGALVTAGSVARSTVDQALQKLSMVFCNFSIIIIQVSHVMIGLLKGTGLGP
jgi:hypothetical protein